MTVNGRGLLPFGHRLAVPASPSLRAVRQLIAEADVVLAIGTEIGTTDYDTYGARGFSIPGRLIRVETALELASEGRFRPALLSSDDSPSTR